MRDIPVLSLVAGPPGAGKTTFIQSQPLPGPVMAVSDDARRAMMNPSADTRGSMMRPDRAAAFLRAEAVESRSSSLVVETTLAGRDAMRLVDRAIERGFRVDAYFVGVRDVDTSIGRVESRMRAGGVGAPNEIVARQFGRSFANLSWLSDRADNVYLVDNSRNRLNIEAAYEHGRLIFRSDAAQPWARREIERLEARIAQDSKALVPPFRNPDMRDSAGRGIDGPSVERAVMADAGVRAGLAEVDRWARGAFRNDHQMAGAARELVLRPRDEFERRASDLVDREQLRGAAGLFATARATELRHDAEMMSRNFYVKLEDVKTRVDQVAERYISEVQAQRLRDRVSIPQLSREAVGAVADIKQAVASYDRDPERAYRTLRDIESSRSRPGAIDELNRFQQAALQRFGSQAGAELLRSAAGGKLGNVTPEVARTVSEASQAFTTSLARTVAHEAGQGTRASLSSGPRMSL